MAILLMKWTRHWKYCTYI